MAIAPEDLERPASGDRALVEAHRRGDPEAFARVVATHYRRLLLQAQRRLGDRSEAEDVVQEVFERAFKAFDRFGGDYRIGPWLSLITSRVCADHGTKRRIARDLPGRVRSHERGDAPDTVDTVPDGVSDPAVLALVRTAIDGLPPSQRSTFMLHEVRGLSYPQVADELGITEDNARARVHRAKRALQGKLSGVRDALAGFLVAPMAARSLIGRLSRHPDPRVRPAAGADLLAGSTSALPVHPAGSPAWTGFQQTAGQVASQVVASPLGQVVTLASASAPRGSLLMGLVAGIAAATTATVAGPGMAALPASAAARPAVSAPRPADRQLAPTLSSASVATSGTPGAAHPGAAVPAMLPTPAPSAPAPVASAPAPKAPTVATPPASTAPPTPEAAWPVIAAGITAGSQSTAGAASGGSAAPTGGSSAAGARPVVVASATGCPWLSAFPGGAPADLTAPPPLAGSPVALLGTTDVPLGTTTDTPTSPVFATSATLTSPTSGAEPTDVSLLAGACLPPAEGVLVVDMKTTDGTEVQLRAALVSTLTDSSATGYLFRGTVVVLTESSAAALASAPLPWGITGDFVAQLLVPRSADTAELSLEFLSSAPQTSGQTVPPASTTGGGASGQATVTNGTTGDGSTPAGTGSVGTPTPAGDVTTSPAG